MIFCDKLMKIAAQAEEALAQRYKKIDDIAFANTSRVMDAFREFRVDATMFDGTTGYGYDDKGRDALDKIYARVFGCEAAFARHSIVNGTQAIATALYGLLRPGDTMLSVTGKPYDTLDKVVGISDDGKCDGSLRDFGVKYAEIPLGEGEAYLDAVEGAIKAHDNIKIVYIQRSKGYMNRRTLSADEIDAITARVRRCCGAYVVVDNCYGEFVETREPNADIIVGSLIKNPGGGVAESGGYIAGSARAVELASYRLTTVGVGLECGASLGNTKNMLRGFFMAPHTVAQALKTAAFAAYVFAALGCDVEPLYTDERYDIIQTVKLGAPEKLCAFCRGIQSGSPIDAYVTPEPWEMPGYSDKVIMAAGTFTQGASIELSADGPLRAPYTAFMQGGVTYESGKIGILSAAQALLEL
ncbi:MAG: methionine gamma-lyase family protein [Eubacteriales bacterium]